MVAMVIVMLITNYSDIQDKTVTNDNATGDSGNNDFGTAVVATLATTVIAKQTPAVVSDPNNK